MKTLYLFRHAKSSWEDPVLKDFERPLNKRGQRDAPEMGRRLAQQKIIPDLIISSPAKRAITTARIIADQIGYSLDKIIQDEALYHGDENVMLDTIKSQSDAINSLMIFGHNPALTNLSNLLTTFNIENIPTAGIVEIKLNTTKRDDLSPSNKNGRQLILFDFPKKGNK